jgi:hypothetical protein
MALWEKAGISSLQKSDKEPITLATLLGHIIQSSTYIHAIKLKSLLTKDYSRKDTKTKPTTKVYLLPSLV